MILTHTFLLGAEAGRFASLVDDLKQKGFDGFADALAEFLGGIFDCDLRANTPLLPTKSVGYGNADEQTEILLNNNGTLICTLVPTPQAPRAQGLLATLFTTGAPKSYSVRCTAIFSSSEQANDALSKAAEVLHFHGVSSIENSMKDPASSFFRKQSISQNRARLLQIWEGISLPSLEASEDDQDLAAYMIDLPSAKS